MLKKIPIGQHPLNIFFNYPIYANVQNFRPVYFDEVEIVKRTRIDTTFQGQKAQLSVCTDKCLNEVGKKLGS